MLQHMLAFSLLHCLSAILPGGRFVLIWPGVLLASALFVVVNDIVGVDMVTQSLNIDKVHDELVKPVDGAPNQKHHRVDVAVAYGCGEAAWSGGEH